ncbi:flagellin [Pseudemcibacter aquimaris]|uniref:flagellin n=1 Tax=Pseudemcibacter aquimaris TaxID=2857064 RepID=UPI0020139127|nr:flagellin [Pseudemcibacter aquimaris]MCC3860802.1 flagellin [Pseudemcibacter aquimaris]WDU59622.1 flagellin [Pseudemcibacter aquimaris]
MGFSVNTNAGALVALQNLNKTNAQLNTVQSKINTGLKVAGAKDDASIFAIAQKQRAELGGLSAVQSSLDRATGALDVAIAGAEAVSDLLIQMKEKAVASKDAGNDATSRGLLDNDYQQLVAQINTIVNNAEFNGRNSLNGTDDIVAIVNADASSQISVAAQDLTATTLNLDDTTIDSETDATTALTAIENAIDTVNTSLSALGAGAKRVEVVGSFVEKLSDAIEVGIGNLVDADLARESANLQSLQVKQQLGLQALSIANQAPGTVLSLFR